MQALFSALRRMALIDRFRNSSAEDDFVEETPEQAFRWCGLLTDGPMTSVPSLAIMGVNGSVQVRGVEGREIRVVAIRRGERAKLKTVRVTVEQNGRGVKVRAIYPRFQWPGRPKVKVDFAVEIPAAVSLMVRLANGCINLKSVTGDAELYTGHGVVSISDSGWVSAEADHGYIHASIREPAWARPLHFRTAEGSIRVELPSSASTRIRAMTINGIVSASFPLAIEKKRYNFLSGVLGADDRRELVCECGNGSVHLSQARA
ncbi:MAG: hypothetical protein LAP21_25425 [Acidobacteriia bacterium]|nr:hypothetical protein [Terriglobia bacterium]